MQFLFAMTAEFSAAAVESQSLSFFELKSLRFLILCLSFASRNSKFGVKLFISHFFEEPSGSAPVKALQEWNAPNTVPALQVPHHWQLLHAATETAGWKWSR